MTAINIMLVVGARPQFIKSAPIIKELMAEKKRFMLTLVHSGQHYDPEMSAIFFRQLKIPGPAANLRVGSGSHATQTASIIKRLEVLISNARPDIVVVPGDTNTTLAAALAAVKLGFPVAHVESGMRSGDMSMPEEINRKLTDHCSSLLFAPTRTAARNLRNEGLAMRTHLTGDTMVDALRMAMPVVQQRREQILERLGVSPQSYVLVTLHRPSNVDEPRRLDQISAALSKIARRLKVVFPVHPRTRGNLAKIGILDRLMDSGVVVLEPQGYIETLSLLRDARCLLTDSGGMQKESFLLHVPCITLRSTTEWPETLTQRANQLVPEPRELYKAVMATAFNEKLRRTIRRLRNPFGDGKASARISRVLITVTERKKHSRLL